MKHWITQTLCQWSIILFLIKSKLQKKSKTIFFVSETATLMVVA